MKTTSLCAEEAQAHLVGKMATFVQVSDQEIILRLAEGKEVAVQMIQAGQYEEYPEFVFEIELPKSTTDDPCRFVWRMESAHDDLLGIALRTGEGDLRRIVSREIYWEALVEKGMPLVDWLDAQHIELANELEISAEQRDKAWEDFKDRMKPLSDFIA